MRLKSFLKKYFLGGEVIYQGSSFVNGEILVLEDIFGRSMRIGGLTQSGGLVVDIWKKGIGEVKSQKIKNCLILGLGCGNSAKIVSKKWPQVKIVGVELDPAVVAVGKQYFGLGEIKNLEIKVGDALKIFKDLDKDELFDLVLVDLYLGKEFPKKAEEQEFLTGLKNILSKDGLIIFNRLNWGEFKPQAKEFTEKLKKIFPKVRTAKTASNLLVISENRDIL